MGQGHSTEELKELFHTLDKDNTGTVNLRQLLNSDLPEIAGTSVGQLFRFDTKHEGSLTFTEFQELVKQLRRLDSASIRQKRSGGLFRRFLKKERSHDNLDEPCWRTLGSQEASTMALGRNDATPAFIGSGKPKGRADEASELSPESFLRETVRKEERKTREYLEHSLRKVEGREMFMNWLFKLVDIDKNNQVQLDELELFLRALARDQIDTAELSYDQEKITPLLLQSIMGEYDIGKTGYLTKEEFMVLADLIIRNYDNLVEEESHVGCIAFLPIKSLTHFLH